MPEEHRADNLNSLPLWMLEAFCREWRVSVTIDNGRITEIVDNEY